MVDGGGWGSLARERRRGAGDDAGAWLTSINSE
ncbi:hypothetical protein SFR_3300 [Streptomyces sp. FR-008]|nr:hypothetical protein SFR_3300 [Streptomyces sp. FR-008]